MNTEISVMYRDGYNYKQHGYVVVAGYDESLVARLRDSLDEDEYFIPEEVGFPNLLDYWESHYEDADHVWHEVEGIEPVEYKVNDSRTLEEVVVAFETAAAKGWPLDQGLAHLASFVESTPEGK